MKISAAFIQRAGAIGSIGWRRAGVISIGFFFIKGLLWITVPLMLYWNR